MAEQDLVNLFKSIDEQMGSLTTTVGAQSVSKIVSSFDGSDPKVFKKWIKNIEKYATLTGMDAGRIKLIAYQSSSGPVSDYLKRYLSTHQQSNWDQVKNELRLRFGEIVDAQHAMLLLKKIKQKKDENIQVYAERMLCTGEDAFDAQNLQTQLIGYFIDGLYLDSMKMKVMRDNPATFNDAVSVATNEQNFKKRFQLRTGQAERVNSAEEPMEVEHSRIKDRCLYCKKSGHLIRDCRARKRRQIFAVNESGTDRAIQYRKKVICFRCNKVGHIARNCFQQREHFLNGHASHM